MTVKVTLSEDPERTVTLPITKTDPRTGPQAPTTPASRQASPSTPATPRSHSPSPPPPTRVDDDGESVKLTFGTNLPTGVTEGTTKETVISITDDDVPSVACGVRVCDLQRGGVGRLQHHRDQGERGVGHGEAVRRPGADGDHTHHQDGPGRRDERRLLRESRPAWSSTRGTPPRSSPSRRRRTRWTTTEKVGEAHLRDRQPADRA